MPDHLRDDFVEFSCIVFGESDPSQMVTLMLAADESLDQYRWEDTYTGSTGCGRDWPGSSGFPSGCDPSGAFREAGGEGLGEIEALADRYHDLFRMLTGAEPTDRQSRGRRGRLSGSR